MNDKEYITEKKRIQKLIKKWVKPLGLGWWYIDFTYNRDNSDESLEYKPREVDGKWEWVMVTSCDPAYLRARIICNLKVVKDLDDYDLEHSFVHELMHIFMATIHSPKTIMAEETIATQLARAFIWVSNWKTK